MSNQQSSNLKINLNKWLSQTLANVGALQRGQVPSDLEAIIIQRDKSLRKLITGQNTTEDERLLVARLMDAIAQERQALQKIQGELSGELNKARQQKSAITAYKNHP